MSCLVGLAALAAGTVLAAPTTEVPARDGDAAGAARGGNGLPELSGVAEGQGNSRTVRMLLELQNAPPPLEGTGDARRVENKAKQAAARAGGEDVVINGAAAAPAVDWRSGLPGRTVNTQTTETSGQVIGREARPERPAPRPMADDQINVKAMLPARVLAFLRENREWVLAGSLVVLGIVWVAASALSQRRR